MYVFSDEVQDVLRLQAASIDLLNGLDGLLECFDRGGVFHAPDDIAVRWDAARAAVEKAVSANILPDYIKGGVTC